jgi:hypothetical protein
MLVAPRACCTKTLGGWPYARRKARRRRSSSPKPVIAAGPPFTDRVANWYCGRSSKVLANSKTVKAAMSRAWKPG